MSEQPKDTVSALARFHGVELQRFLVRMTGRHDVAEEIAQHAFMKLHRYGHGLELEKGGHGRALLFDAARKLALTYLRNRTRAEKVFVASMEGVDATDASAGPERLAMAEQAMQALGHIVDRLPRRLREVFVKRHLLDMSHSLIAAELHISVRAVEKRLIRAVALCRVRMVQRGHDWPGLD
jgi:RNA polymerase sigma-70 factor (ECF subfamily)